jgi:subtilisin family serine protease
MRLRLGTRARVGAGLVSTTLLAAGAVIALRGADDDRARGDGDKVSFDTNGLPVATDAHGQPIDPAVDNEPELDDLAAAGPDRFDELQASRAAQAAKATPPPAKPQPGDLDPTPGEPEAAPDSLLVSFDPGTSDADVAAALAAAGVEGERIGASDSYKVTTADADHAELTTKLEAAAGVAKVEPNLIRQATKVPNDPQVTTQRQYLDALGIQPAWDVANTGSGVTVAVIDTGVDRDHPDLAPNLIAGWDFVSNDNNPQDDNGHGTMTSGVIGAVTNNGTGVAGVAWNARIMPIKVLDANGFGDDADIADAVYWAIDHGATVINLSLGGPGASFALDQAISAAIDSNIVVVAAAGNSGTREPSFPAAFPGVLAVSATDHGGQYAAFSNYGWWVSLAAPGINVRTTALAPGAAAAYADGTGTSFSSPIVAGVAALVRERHPTWDQRRIRWELARTAKDAGPAGIDETYGFGIVNAAGALGVSGGGTVAQPNLAGDAGNVANSARAITPGTPATETLGYELDEDWFSFNVAAPSGVTITVTPPAADPAGLRARELDPVVAAFGPGSGQVGFADDTFEGEPETIRFNAAAGTHRINVTNYFGSAGPSAYTVSVQLSAPLPLSKLSAPSAAYSVATREEMTKIADVTGDGLADAVLLVGGGAASGNLNQLVVLPQQPDGSLGAAQVLATHTLDTGTQGLAVGDLDGDGDLDVAIAVAEGLDVAWQTETGLTEPTLYTSIPSFRLVRLDTPSAADDLLADNAGSLVRLHWNGSGFDTAPSITLGATMAWTVGDATGDGLEDIVTARTDSVTVHAQQGDGSWISRTPIALGDVTNTLTSAAIGDITGDGRNDVVVAAGGTEPVLLYFVQQPDGTISRNSLYGRQALPAPGPIAIADVNADGRSDVVVAHGSVPAGDPSTLSVYRQTPIGSLAIVPDMTDLPPETGAIVNSLATGDLTGDGYEDIAAARPGSGLQILRQQVSTATTAEGAAKPWFNATLPAPHTAGVARTVSPAITFGRDINASSVSYGVDGTVLAWSGRSNLLIDANVSLSGRTLTIDPLVSLTPGTPYTIGIFGIEDTAGNPVFGSFTFTTATAPPPTFTVNTTYAPFKVDLTSDGFDEVVWYTPSLALDPIWLFTEDGQFDWGQFRIDGTYVPIAGDFDGNGYQDIFWYSPGPGTDTMWYWGINGAGELDLLSTPVYNVSGTYVPVAGDFDRNGYDDIFWYGPGSAGEALWSFRAGNAYTSKPMPPANATGYRLAAGDYNRDGYDDVFWHMPGTGGEALWKGGATGFTSTPATAVNGSYNLLAGDYTGDGFDDIYWYAGSAASIWRGGATTFTSQAAPAVASTARPVAGDFTADGYDDLLAYVPGTTPDRLLPGKPTGL